MGTKRLARSCRYNFRRRTLSSHLQQKMYDGRASVVCNRVIIGVVGKPQKCDLGPISSKPISNRTTPPHQHLHHESTFAAHA